MTKSSSIVQRVTVTVPSKAGTIVLKSGEKIEFKAKSERSAQGKVLQALKIRSFTARELRKKNVQSITLAGKVIFDSDNHGHSSSPFASDKAPKRHHKRRSVTAR